jgi:serine/threonine protein kinase
MLISALHCPIQLIYTVDITAETIKKVAAEASILSSIRHKNIVNILGVSVLPPRYVVLYACAIVSAGSVLNLLFGRGHRGGDYEAFHEPL